jgi:hypothetical protein
MTKNKEVITAVTNYHSEQEDMKMNAQAACECDCSGCSITQCTSEKPWTQEYNHYLAYNGAYLVGWWN